MRKLKKALSILLSFLMIFSMFTIVPFVSAGAAELPDCTFDPPEGKTFKAWSDNETLKQPGESVSITSGYTKTITAVWAEVYAIKIDLPDNAHGSVAADKDEATQGETITLTVTPDEGYALETLRVKNDSNGMNLVVENDQFRMPASDVTVIAVFKAAIPYVNAQGRGYAPCYRDPPR